MRQPASTNISICTNEAFAPSIKMTLFFRCIPINSSIEMMIFVALVLLLGVASSKESLKSSNSNCSCGYSAKPKQFAEGRIVGGTDARLNEFPLIGALEYDDFPGRVFCGSTVITKKHALTASHCNPGPFMPISIVLGEHDTNNTDESETVTIPIIHFINHEKYHLKGNSEHDIALVVLESEIPFGPTIGPACFPDNKALDLVGKKVRIIGWGRLMYRGETSSVLKKVDVNVVPMEMCEKVFVGTTNKQMCTYTLKKDACQGDSGGPVIYMEPSTRRYTIVGVVSYGIECAKPGTPAINTLVSSYRSWILNKIAETDSNSTVCQQQTIVEEPSEEESNDTSDKTSDDKNDDTSDKTSEEIVDDKIVDESDEKIDNKIGNKTDHK